MSFDLLGGIKKLQVSGGMRLFVKPGVCFGRVKSEAVPIGENVAVS